MAESPEGAIARYTAMGSKETVALLLDLGSPWFIFLSRLSLPVLPLPARTTTEPEILEALGRIYRSGLDVKDAVDDFVVVIERYP